MVTLTVAPLPRHLCLALSGITASGFKHALVKVDNDGQLAQLSALLKKKLGIKHCSSRSPSTKEHHCFHSKLKQCTLTMCDSCEHLLAINTYSKQIVPFKLKKKNAMQVKKLSPATTSLSRKPLNAPCLCLISTVQKAHIRSNGLVIKA